MNQKIRDCGYDDDGLWFRYRATAIILHDGKVLMARNETSPYYYSIGGGVHHGESAIDAVKREVLEETGVHVAEARYVGMVERDSGSGSTYVIADFAFTGHGDPRGADDADDARWCDAAEIGHLDTSPGLVEALREWGYLG